MYIIFWEKVVFVPSGFVKIIATGMVCWPAAKAVFNLSNYISI
jgi:hypothetical protein